MSLAHLQRPVSRVEISSSLNPATEEGCACRIAYNPERLAEWILALSLHTRELKFDCPEHISLLVVTNDELNQIEFTLADSANLDDVLGLLKEKLQGTHANPGATALDEDVDGRLRIAIATDTTLPAKQQLAKWSAATALIIDAGSGEASLLSSSTAQDHRSHEFFCSILVAMLDRASGPKTAPTSVSRLLLSIGRVPHSLPARPDSGGNLRHERYESAFREMASSSPDAVAIRHGGAQWSYSELDTLSDRLAARLLSDGTLRSGAVIGIRVVPSVYFFVAALGVWKAGAAYVPLGPRDPDEAVDMSLLQCRADAIIVTRDVSGANFSSARLDHDSILENLKVQELHHPHGAPATQDCSKGAYVLFTSGTTGVPKGAVISHAGLLHFLHWYRRLLDFGANDRMIQNAPLTFDFSVPELWLPLICGGEVVIPSMRFAESPMAYVDELVASRVQVAQFVPSLLGMFLDAVERCTGRHDAEEPEPPRQPTSLTTVVTNGEPLPDLLRRRFYSLFPHARLVNSYGPTEATVTVTYYECPRDPSTGTMFIGRAAAGNELYILNRQLRPVPAGSEGELFIGGPQVALGYVNDDELTKTRFFEIQTDQGTERVYRTGDLVRQGENGDLIFIGRTDLQVKVRGVRIEPEGIEALATQSGLIKQAACVLLSDDGEANTGLTLVLFVSPATVETDELARLLRKSGGKGAAPSHIRAVPELPVNRNGKVDRNALALLAKAEFRGAGHMSHDAREVSPSASEMRRFLEILGRETGREIKESTNICDLDIDSLSLIQLQIALGEAGFVFDADAFFEASNVQEFFKRTTRRRDHDQGGARCAASTRAGPDRDLATAFNWWRTFDPQVLVLHSSISHLFGSEGAAGDEQQLSALKDTALEEVRRLLADGITIVVPAFSFAFFRHRNYHFQLTPPETGLLARWLLNGSGFGRTRDPLYSFLVAGPHAETLLAATGRTPFDSTSIFAALSKLNASIATLGKFGMTQAHRCEDIAQVPYLCYRQVQGFADYGTGREAVEVLAYIRDWPNGPCVSPRLGQDVPKMVRLLGSTFQSRRIGPTQVGHVRTRDLEVALVEALHADPFVLLKAKNKDFVTKILGS